MTTQYTDPSNLNEILLKIPQLKTLGEIVAFIQTIWPNFIIGFIKEYSEDYPELKQNWIDLCNKHSIQPKEIMIVDNFNSNVENHKLVNVVCDIFLQLGFLVRKKHEIIPCWRCGKALPSMLVFGNLKNLSIREWKDSCQDC